LSPKLAKALKIVEEERRTFTDDVLSKIAKKSAGFTKLFIPVKA